MSALALDAGVGVNGRFGDSSVEDELSLVDLNVRSTVHLAHLAVRDMVAAGAGRILVTSSIAAVAPGRTTRRTPPRRRSSTPSRRASGWS